MSEGCGCGVKERDGDGMKTGKKDFSVWRFLCIYRTLLAAQKE